MTPAGRPVTLSHARSAAAQVRRGGAPSKTTDRRRSRKPT